MKKILAFLFAVLLTNFSALATCLTESDFYLFTDRNAEYLSTPCLTVSDLGHIKAEENVVFRLESATSTTGVSAVWKVNSVTISSSSSFPNATEFIHAFSAPGVYEVSCEYTFDGSCMVTKTIEVEIFENDCPGIEYEIYNYAQLKCIGSTTDLSITGATVLESTASFYVTDMGGNIIGGYQVPGDGTITYVHAGIFSILYQIDIVSQDGSGDLCYTTLLANDNSCWEQPISISTDPYFSCEQAIDFGEDLDIHYQGQIVSTAPYNNEYKLYLDGTYVTTAIDPVFDELIHTFAGLSVGTHEIKLTGRFNQAFDAPSCWDSTVLYVDVRASDSICESCNTFKPMPGEEYWISAWVHEAHTDPVKSFDDAYIQIGFTGSGSGASTFTTSGNIIDGWQRIVGKFTVPALTTDLSIQLKNDNSSFEAYFDDIRIHPFNASMKSYVYDPVTLWLTAELDDNNYATFYEYDNEGQLVRIKKETARGIMTIQESRSSNPKSE